MRAAMVGGVGYLRRRRAAVALLEHRWATALRDTIRDAGGFHLADAWVHPADLIAVGLIAAEEAAAQ
jgi:hypothetical protein